MGGFDDEILVVFEPHRQMAHLVFRPHHPIEFRHGDARGRGQFLGAQLVIHQGIIAAGIVGQGELGVAPVDPHDPQIGKTAAQSEHHSPSLVRTLKRKSSNSR